MDRAYFKEIVDIISHNNVLLYGPAGLGKSEALRELRRHFSHTVFFDCNDSDQTKSLEVWAPAANTEILLIANIEKLINFSEIITKVERFGIKIAASSNFDSTSLSQNNFSKIKFLPLTPAEKKDAELNDFLVSGGFPKPFSMKSAKAIQNWRKQNINTLLREEIFELGNIQNLKPINAIFSILQTNIGRPMAYKKIADAIEIAPNSAIKYISLLEKLNLIFSITPFAANIPRALKKEPKFYFYDTGIVDGTEHAKIENFIAVALLKHVHYRSDFENLPYELKYLRTKEKHACDFAIINNGEIEQLIDFEYKDKPINRSLKKFCDQHGLYGLQLSRDLNQEEIKHRIRKRKLIDYLRELII